MSISSLPPHLKAYRAQLVMEPLFQELIRALPRTSLPDYWPSKGSDHVDNSHANWAYYSGKVNAEKNLLAFLGLKEERK